MSENNGSPGRSRRSATRLALLASACLGLVALGGGVENYHLLAQPAAQAAEAPQAPSGFADLVAKVKPAVISVRVRIVDRADTSGSGPLPVEPGSPLDRFFRQFGFPDMPNGVPNGERVITGEGSGFFISADGYAVTNYHVVDHAKSVTVTTDDGKHYTAKVVGSDQRTDLALIKVDANRTFPYVTFADHTPRVGDWVVAVGNPFGLGGTVTAGIVSARGRDIGSGPYEDFIQIDAPINKGNSGGPAFDTDGHVIGVNTAIYSPTGGSVGIGFDIPASTVKTVVAQLRTNGKVTRGWIGVQVQPVTADIAESLGMAKAEGAIVDQPQSGSPAATAGIESGDVITAVNGTPIKDARHLARTIAAIAPGTSVNLSIFHNGQEKNVTLTLGTLPRQQTASNSNDNDSGAAGVPRLGLLVAPAGSVAGAGDRGVVITRVDPDGPAAGHGLQTGDVILEVGGRAVSNPAELRNQLSELRKQGKQSVLMRIRSGNTTKFVALPLHHA